jgi:hypothetical protein
MAEMRNVAIILGFVLILVFVGFSIIDPTAFDKYTTPGRDVRFTAHLDRGLLADPNVASVTAQALPMAVSSASLDTKVDIEISGYKTITTSIWQSQYTGGSGTVYADTYVPYGTYTTIFRSYNRGGEACFPTCSWVLDSTITKRLTVTEAGVSLI